MLYTSNALTKAQQQQRSANALHFKRKVQDSSRHWKLWKCMYRYYFSIRLSTSQVIDCDHLLLLNTSTTALTPLSTQNVLPTVRVFVQQQQHTRAHTQTRIAYSLLYVFVRHPTTKCVWHNNHESRQRLWTPISKSCDSFLFTFAPDVRRRHLYRSRLTNTHTYSQAHAQTPTVYPTVVADLQSETERDQERTRMRASAQRSKAEQTWGAEQQWESVKLNQWALDGERERRQRCCCCCCWPREGAPLTCTLTSNTEQSNSYRPYSRTHPHTHVDPPLHFLAYVTSIEVFAKCLRGLLSPFYVCQFAYETQRGRER